MYQYWYWSFDFYALIFILADVTDTNTLWRKLDMYVCFVIQFDVTQHIRHQREQQYLKQKTENISCLAQLSKLRLEELNLWHLIAGPIIGSAIVPLGSSGMCLFTGFFRIRLRIRNHLFDKHETQSQICCIIHTLKHTSKILHLKTLLPWYYYIIYFVSWANPSQFPRLANECKKKGYRPNISKYICLDMSAKYVC